MQVPIRFCRHQAGKSAEVGATMVEVALSAFIFFIFIFLLIWAALYLNIRTSLTLAVNNALRLAITRGDLDIIKAADTDNGIGPIARVGDYINNDSSASLGVLTGLLTSGVSSAQAYDYYNRKTLQPCFSPASGSLDLKTAPPIFHYILIYVSESMKNSVGSQVRFPCDQAEDPAGLNGSGCLTCFFGNPDWSPASTAASKALCKSPKTNCLAGAPCPPTQTIVLSCTYRSDLLLISSLAKLLNMPVPSIAITRTAAYGRPPPV